MKIVVLGASGQAGQAIGELAGEQGIDALLFARQQVDITSAAAVVSALGAAGSAVVVNAAAFTEVDAAEVNPPLAFEVNCQGAAIVAEACRRCRLPLVHISTDYVFDGEKAAPYVETDPARPLNVYGASKEAGERAIRRTHDWHVIIRTSWLFGPARKNFLKTIVKLAATKDSWGVVDDQLGTPTSTADLAAAIVAVARRIAAREECWGVYHFAGDEAVTRLAFARSIVRAQATYTRRYPTLHPILSADYLTAARRPSNSRLSSRLFEARFGVRAGPLARRIDQAVDRIFSRS